MRWLGEEIVCMQGAVQHVDYAEADVDVEGEEGRGCKGANGG